MAGADRRSKGATWPTANTEGATGVRVVLSMVRARLPLAAVAAARGADKAGQKRDDDDWKRGEGSDQSQHDTDTPTTPVHPAHQSTVHFAVGWSSIGSGAPLVFTRRLLLLLPGRGPLAPVASRASSSSCPWPVCPPCGRPGPRPVGRPACRHWRAKRRAKRARDQTHHTKRTSKRNRDTDRTTKGKEDQARRIRSETRPGRAVLAMSSVSKHWIVVPGSASRCVCGLVVAWLKTASSACVWCSTTERVGVNHDKAREGRSVGSHYLGGLFVLGRQKRERRGERGPAVQAKCRQ